MNDIRNSLELYHSEVERKADKRILSYIAMFILQWIPSLIAQGARLVKVKYSINLMINKKNFYFVYLFYLILIKIFRMKNLGFMLWELQVKQLKLLIKKYVILNLINIFLTGLSFGGIGNVIQFIINEGFIPRSYHENNNNFAEICQI